jgi:hypothetical protein
VSDLQSSYLDAGTARKQFLQKANVPDPLWSMRWYLQKQKKMVVSGGDLGGRVMHAITRLEFAREGRRSFKVSLNGKGEECRYVTTDLLQPGKTGPFDVAVNFFEPCRITGLFEPEKSVGEVAGWFRNVPWSNATGGVKVVVCDD